MSKPDVERVKDLVECMGDALVTFEHEFSAVELLSAEATLFTSSAQVIIAKAPEARQAVEALLYHMLASVAPSTGTVH